MSLMAAARRRGLPPGNRRSMQHWRLQWLARRSTIPTRTCHRGNRNRSRAQRSRPRAHPLQTPRRSSDADTVAVATGTGAHVSVAYSALEVTHQSARINSTLGCRRARTARGVPRRPCRRTGRPRWPPPVQTPFRPRAVQRGRRESHANSVAVASGTRSHLGHPIRIVKLFL